MIQFAVAATSKERILVMIFVKKYIKVFRETMQKIKFRRKLRQIDKWWYYMGGSSWGLFPPSFYYTHTEEEVERIATETVAEIQELINRLKQV